MAYQALLIVSFGGPEREEEVIPFLENVLRGRNVPRERMLEVAGHYYHFGGRSPINDQNRALIAALEADWKTRGPALPIYWGNRNWRPFLADTIGEMARDGIGRALALATSAFGSYSGCRQYMDDLDTARAKAGKAAPEIEKLPTFHNRPGFIEAMTERVRAALEQIPAERRAAAPVVFTAHSIPLSMAETSPYVRQLEEACGLVSEALGRTPGALAYQSRSGPPAQPWLEPDIGDYVRELHAAGGLTDLVVAPIGFLSDHMEVIYDLDLEVRGLCGQLGVNLVRAGTVGVHPAFVETIREMVLERMNGAGGFEGCAAGCCTGPRRPR